MTLDFLVVLACCILALVAHGSRHQGWLAWILRLIIGFFFAGEALSAAAMAEPGNTWSQSVLLATCIATGLLLFSPCRLGISFVLTCLEALVSGQVFLAVARKSAVVSSFLAEKIFVASSTPHMVALWIYVTAFGYLLASIDPSSLKMPALPIPMPVMLDQLFSYNGFGLVLLSFCGVGIFITRKPREAARRLGFLKPTWPQVAIGLALIFFTFAYDAAWATITHSMEGGLASKLTGYNAGTFGAGGLGAAVLLALATSLCAGIGEETLIRGAVQPALGILPAALLHGVLHGQFSHAPVFMLQVAGWSMLMGIVRRYTNTTTTIIGHAGFNLITAFLFAFNP